MPETPELNLLYATDLTDDVALAGRAIARLAASSRVRLTVAHVLRHGADGTAARAALDARVAALGAGAATPLLLRDDDPAAALATVCSGRGIDLLLAAEPRRAALLRWIGGPTPVSRVAACDVPVWTLGPASARGANGAPVRSIACLVDFERRQFGLLSAAAAVARACGASLTLLHVVRPVDEGALLFATSARRAFSAREARQRLATLAAATGMAADLLVTEGHPHGELPDLVAHARADMVFMADGALSGWPFSMARTLARLPCAAVRVDVPVAPAWWALAEQAEPLAAPDVAPAR
jgi:hypothetical protein